MKTIIVLACFIGFAAAAAYQKKDHDDHDDHDQHDHHDHDEHKTAELQKIKANGRHKEPKQGELKNMEMEGLIPDILKKLPSKPLSVTFEKKAATFGNELAPTEVKNQPKITWEAEKDALYTLAMFDLDAPNSKTPILREVIHWLVVNIPGADIASGETIAPFFSSGPLKGSGLHRYVFLLFKQAKKLTVDEPKIPALSKERRLNFKVAKFVEKYQLGDAAAGNFYKAQWDAYVDERNKKLKD